MKAEGTVKNCTIFQPSPFQNQLYRVELEDGTEFDFPLDNPVVVGKSYKFYCNNFFWGINSLERI